MEAPLVSIVIVCMNRMDNLYPCLEGLRAHTGVPYECFVVAYRFSPENLAKAQADFPWVHWVVSDEVRGFAENNNLALRQARGRYCFPLNDDTEIGEDVVGALVRDMERLPEDAAIVSPRLLNADGSLQLCGRPDYPAFKYVLQQWHLYSEPTDNGSGLFRTFNASGAAFLIKTSIFKELGWFDERYFFTPEDIALTTLARRRGYSVWCDADASVIHKWRTTSSPLAPAVRPCAIRGSLIFFADGSPLRYFCLGLGVWAAEMAKRIKARFSGNKTDYITYKHNTRSIFTRLTPKEIFARYFNEI